jgi:hypothetical protein
MVFVGGSDISYRLNSVSLVEIDNWNSDIQVFDFLKNEISIRFLF